MKKIYSRFFKKVIFMSLVPKKTTTASIDYLKIVENVVHKVDAVNLMCISISIGRRGKKKSFANALVSGAINVLKTSARYVSIIWFVTQDATFQNSLNNEIRRKRMDERKQT